jgi:hypothetical protein
VIYKIEDTEIIPFLAFDFGSGKNPYDINFRRFVEEFDHLEYTGQINNLYRYGNKLFFLFKHTTGIGIDKPIEIYSAYMSLDELNPVIYQLGIKHSPEIKIQPLPEILGLSKGKLIFQLLPGLLSEEHLTKTLRI